MSQHPFSFSTSPDSDASSKRLFTPAEATRTLPLVKRIVAYILMAGRELRSIYADQGQSAESSPEFREKMSAFQDLLGELEAIGCSFKDWNFTLGLVDFSAIIDGEKVLLCWRSDGESLEWYHGYEDGFAGRKRIPAELFSEDEVSSATS